MPLDSHLSQLERKHRELEQEIEAELHRPAWDAIRITELKRRKLSLKDKIHRIQRLGEAH
jgi:hypothetical protein